MEIFRLALVLVILLLLSILMALFLLVPAAVPTLVSSRRCRLGVGGSCCWSCDATSGSVCFLLEGRSNELLLLLSLPSFLLVAVVAGIGTEVPPFALVIKSCASFSVLKLLNLAFGNPLVCRVIIVVVVVVVDHPEWCMVYVM